MSVDGEYNRGGPEKRRFKRCSLEMLVGVIRDGQFSFEYSMQLSEGGMLLAVYNTYKVGDQLEINFFMPPTGDVVLVRAEVVYGLEPKGGKQYIGLRFIDPAPSTVNLIRKYVSETRSIDS